MYKSEQEKRYEKEKENFFKRLRSADIESLSEKIKNIPKPADLESAGEASTEIKTLLKEIKQLNEKAETYKETIPQDLQQKIKELKSAYETLNKEKTRLESYLTKRFNEAYNDAINEKTAISNINAIRSHYDVMSTSSSILNQDNPNTHGKMQDIEDRLKDLYKKKKKQSPEYKKESRRKKAISNLIAAIIMGALLYHKREPIITEINHRISTHYTEKAEKTTELEKIIELTYLALEKDENNTLASEMHNQAIAEYVTKYENESQKINAEKMLNTLERDIRNASSPEPFLAIKMAMENPISYDDIEKIEELTRKELRLDKHMSSLYFNLSNAYQKANQDEKALAEAIKAYKLWPSNKKTMRQYGLALYTNNIYDKAAKVLSRCVTPKSKIIYQIAYGVSLNRIDHAKESIPYLQRAIEYAPSMASLHVYLASAYGKLEMYDNARKELKKAYRLGKNAAEREKITTIIRNFEETHRDQ